MTRFAHPDQFSTPSDHLAILSVGLRYDLTRLVHAKACALRSELRSIRASNSVSSLANALIESLESSQICR
jgi:hypothetical protein